MIIIMVKSMKYDDKIYTVCYDTLDVFNTKEEAKKFYSECYYMSEGAEHERYASILVDLNFSNLGKDHVSTDCREISIKMNSNEDEFLKINLNKYLSIEDTIKYYEEKIAPILEVSNDYGVNFLIRTPFEDFGSDSESYTNTSFSDYYKELLEKFNLKVDNIQTESRSDGKYTITINDEEFDIVAWDDLQGVIDNVDSMIETLGKENNREKYTIEYWETDWHRDAGEGMIYNKTFFNSNEAISKARELYYDNGYSSVEVLKGNGESLFCCDNLSEEFYYDNNRICLVDEKVVKEYIDNWSNNKEQSFNGDKLYCKENNKFVAIDNSTGDCWVEEFKTEKEAQDWLLGKDLEEDNDYEI